MHQIGAACFYPFARRVLVMVSVRRPFGIFVGCNCDRLHQQRTAGDRLQAGDRGRPDGRTGSTSSRSTPRSPASSQHRFRSCIVPCTPHPHWFFQFIERVLAVAIAVRWPGVTISLLPATSLPARRIPTPQVGARPQQAGSGHSGSMRSTNRSGRSSLRRNRTTRRCRLQPTSRNVVSFPPATHGRHSSRCARPGHHFRQCTLDDVMPGGTNGPALPARHATSPAGPTPAHIAPQQRRPAAALIDAAMTTARLTALRRVFIAGLPPHPAQGGGSPSYTCGSAVRQTAPGAARFAAHHGAFLLAIKRLIVLSMSSTHSS